MESFDPETFEIKYTIVAEAVKQYEKKAGEFTLKDVAGATELTVGEIFDHFPNKEAILRYFYEALIIRYRLMLEEIEDFENYLLSEKLSNFAFTSFDMLGEHENFVRKTFRPLVICSYSKTGFEKRINQLLKDFFQHDNRISPSATLLLNDFTYKLFYQKYIVLINFWLKDDSDGKEVSMELTDKFTAFIQEIMYNAAVDRGFDLAKILVNNSIKSIKKFFPEIEIRD